MARVKLEDVDKVVTSSTQFFQMKNDGDIEKVNILYETIDDVECHSLHKVKVNGRDRWVECLREVGNEVEACPLCASGSKIALRVFVPLYVNGQVQFWERGKSFVDDLKSYCNRYKPLCGMNFEIERQGEKGNTQTKYQFFPLEKNGKTLKDFPEVPEVPDQFLLTKTADELYDFLDTGIMPGFEATQEKKQEVQPRRREGSPRTNRRREVQF